MCPMCGEPIELFLKIPYLILGQSSRMNQAGQGVNHITCEILLTPETYPGYNHEYMVKVICLSYDRLNEDGSPQLTCEPTDNEYDGTLDSFYNLRLAYPDGIAMIVMLRDSGILISPMNLGLQRNTEQSDREHERHLGRVPMYTVCSSRLFRSVVHITKDELFHYRHPSRRFPEVWFKIAFELHGRPCRENNYRDLTHMAMNMVLRARDLHNMSGNGSTLDYIDHLSWAHGSNLPTDITKQYRFPGEMVYIDEEIEATNPPCPS